MARKIVLGNLNKAIVAIRFSQFPQLNITADALDEGMLSVSTQGEITSMLPTATGMIGSPNPYIAHAISFKVVKTNPLAQQLKNQIRLSSILGDLEITADASTLDRETYFNSFVQTYDTWTYNGKEPAIGFTIMCYEAINNSMYGA